MPKDDNTVKILLVVIIILLLIIGSLVYYIYANPCPCPLAWVELWLLWQIWILVGGGGIQSLPLILLV